MTATAPKTARFGGQSMVAPLRRVMVRRPVSPVTGGEWAPFGFLHAVDHDLTDRQHAAFRQTLTEAGVEVIEATTDPAGMLDAIFAFDPSMVTDRGAILLSMGKPERTGEMALHEATYEALGIPVIGRIEAPGTVEGGDTLWFDERTFAIGRGYRTNDSGINQLKAILEPMGITVLVYDLPHFHGAAECLHLMSLISPLADRLAIVHKPLMATAFVQELEARGWTLIDTDEAEYDTMATNVLAIAPRKVLMLSGNPVTEGRIRAAGCEVLTYDGSEVSCNRFGGPTCLTKPIWRETGA